ncbi:hypothetical protein BJY00DRAFT_307813 [Aspergillus carlsbadensis]|nr:hypothetical protein BJY00DRAFT_307813 [Aspergillus carlsbadensis]
MVRIVPHIYASQALAALQPVGGLALGASDRTNTDGTGESLGTDNIHNKDPVLAELWPEYGIEHAIIYSWPEVFLGFGATEEAAEALDNTNYNRPDGDTRRITHESGFYDTVELFDVGAEADLQNTPDVQDDYNRLFPIFAAIAHGVANASDEAGVGAWGGNRIWTSQENNTLYNPFVSRFYKDCKEQNVPLRAATFHFPNAQLSFDPYDVRKVTENLREQVLIPAGFPDLPIWMTEYGPNPSGVKPTSRDALDAYNDPAFTASFTIGTDSPIDQTFTWPGFGWGGSGAGSPKFAPWFEKSANGFASALNQASA